MKNQDMELTKRIIKERERNGIVTAVVCGKFGIGKSMYCLQIAYELYRYLDYNEHDAWMNALNSMVYKPVEYATKIKNLGMEVSPIIIIDDASVHIGSDLYQTNPKLYSAFKQSLTTIRTKTGALLYNCPMPEEIAKFIRNSDAYQIWLTIEPGSKYERLATAWEWRRRSTKNGIQRRQYKAWLQPFSCYIPKKYFDIYQAKRKLYISQPIERILEDDENNGREKPKE